MMTALRWLAKAKVLRGGAFDVFGYTEERRTERALIERFERRVGELLETLSVGTSRRPGRSPCCR